MLRTHTAQKSSFVAAASLALGTSILSLLYTPAPPHWNLAPWNIALFLVPLLFGISGTGIAIAITWLSVVLLHAEHTEPLRLSTTILAIALTRVAAPTVPAFLVVLAVWLTLFLQLPALFVARHIASYSAWTEEFILFTCMQDVLFAMVAGAVSLNRNIAPLIARVPRRQRIGELCINLLALSVLISTLVTLAALQRAGLISQSALTTENTAAAFLLFTALILFFTLIGYRIEYVFSRDFIVASAPALDQISGFRPFTDRRPRLTTAEILKSGFSSRPSEPPVPAGSAMSGVCVVDDYGSVLYNDTRFRMFAHISPEEIVGSSLHQLAAESELITQIVRLIQETAANHTFTVERRVGTTPEDIRYFEISVRPTAETPSVHGRIIAVRDITTQRVVAESELHEVQLNSLQTIARSASDALNRILGGLGEQAQRGIYAENPETFEAVCKEIVHHTWSAQRIAQILSAMATPTVQKLHTPLELNTLLAEQLALLTGNSPSHTTVQFIPSAEELPITASSPLVMHAITQLLVTSLADHPHDASPLEISCAAEEIDQSMADIHPGISAGRFGRIRLVNPSRSMSTPDILGAAQVAPSARRKTGGTNPNLATVFTIMRQHDGFMTIESKGSRGTCISLYFPLREVGTSKMHPQTESRPEV